MPSAPPEHAIHTLSRTISPPGNLTRLRRALGSQTSSVILESLSDHPKIGRYSIFGWDPVRTISPARNPAGLAQLQAAFGTQYQFANLPPDIPLAAGWVGHLNYETGYLFEPSAGPAPHGSAATVGTWSLFDTLVIHDHAKEIWTAFAADLPRELTLQTRPTAQDRLDQMARLFDALTDDESGASNNSPPHSPGSWNYSRREYLEKCQKVLEYIRAGDIFQVNLARRYRQSFREAPVFLYDRLCRMNPATFAAFLSTAQGAIVSSSPEQFLELRDGAVTTRPIKGTRPRCNDSAADEAARRDLVTHPKDRAELDMIVDLERNDLGRVCQTGTVEVVHRGEVEILPTVFHRTAMVRGQLRPDADAFDLIRATFPGGSVTGAPKIRAMQIIRELEVDPRGVYCGAIGYIGLNGDMQLNLAIRTMTVAGGCADMHVGSGIVADSQPEQELAELDAKAAAMLAALDSRSCHESRTLEHVRD